MNCCTVVYLVTVLACLASLAHGQTDCSDKEDGIYGIGCKSYDICKDGQMTNVECTGSLVYNDRTQQCDEPKNVPPPCGVYHDCTHLPDGTYTDYSQNCTAYYTCFHHMFYGHNFCIAGTVFEQTLGTCVWPMDAYPPCGTKSDD